jgi:hypothetical protein
MDTGQQDRWSRGEFLSPSPERFHLIRRSAQRFARAVRNFIPLQDAATPVERLTESQSNGYAYVALELLVLLRHLKPAPPFAPMVPAELALALESFHDSLFHLFMHWGIDPIRELGWEVVPEDPPPMVHGPADMISVIVNRDHLYSISLKLSVGICQYVRESLEHSVGLLSLPALPDCPPDCPCGMGAFYERDNIGNDVAVTITLRELAELVGRSKRTLERYKQGMPRPALEGKGRKAALWHYRTVRRWLELTFNVSLPDHLPNGKNGAH